VVPGGGCEVFVFDVGVVDHVEMGVPFEFPDDAAFVEASFLVFVAHESYAVICNPLENGKRIESVPFRFISK